MEKGYWINKDTRTFLSRGYIDATDTVENRIKVIAATAQRILKIDGYAEKFEDYLLRGWYSLSSPVWSNFGSEKGLPISCNGSFVGDSVEEFFDTSGEIGVMSKWGSGTSAYLGAIRARGTAVSRGGTADGPEAAMNILETTANVISQSNVRRGSCAVYLPVEHPDIEDFLNAREEGSSIHHLSLGVTITDKWMEEMIAGDPAKRKVWARIIRKRFEFGYPYLFFHDTVNNGRPEVYKELDMTVWASNLCSEIALPSSIDESFVCCLSSMNLLHYDDWKDTDAVEVLTMFLDAVMEEYVTKTANLRYMEKAHRFAKNHRALGLGVLGWHSYLQSHMIPFESEKAKALNIEIHALIKQRAYKASEDMAKTLGEAPIMKGRGRRNTTLLAIAPTTSSSFILGQVSPSVEPLNSNYYVKALAKGKFTYKNPYLKALLKKYDKDTPEIWDIILKTGGSVKNLFFLTQEEREVFKTFGEISQWEIIKQAGDRQKFIDQAQSINLMVHPDTPIKDINLLLIEAWRLGLKSLYYQRSTNPSQELARSLVSCVACEA